MEKGLEKNFILFIIFLWSNFAFTQVLFENLYQDASIHGGYSIQPTKDNGYIIVGLGNPSGGIGGGQACLLKVDSLGVTQWANNYGASGGSDYGFHVIQTLDSGYVFTGAYGSSSEDVYIVKTDNDGDLLWEKHWGSLDAEVCFGMVEIPSDSGLVIVGAIGDYPRIIRTDKNGDTLWTKTFSDTAGFYNIIHSSDGGYIMCGAIGGYLGLRSFVFKTDNLGNEIWRNEFVGGGGERLYKTVEQNNGNLAVVGYSLEDSPPPKVDAIVRILDSQGDQLSYNTYGGVQDDYFLGSCLTPTNGLVMVGTTTHTVMPIAEDRILAVKVDENINSIWEVELGNNDGVQWGRDVCRASDGGYVICGDKANNDGAHLYLLKINENGSLVSTIELQLPQIGLSVYPNPFQDVTTITFEKELDGNHELILLSSNGQMVFSDKLEIGTIEYNLNRNNLPAGMYILNIIGDKTNWTRKLIVR